MNIEIFVSLSLRDTSITDRHAYDHCPEKHYKPEHYPHHTIAGYALFARVSANGETLDHHLGFATERDALQARIDTAMSFQTAMNYYDQ